MKQKLLVLCGGQSSEHIVSRMSCTSVLNNLNHDKYDITLVGIDLDGKWYRLNHDQETKIHALEERLKVLKLKMFLNY